MANMSLSYKAKAFKLATSSLKKGIFLEEGLRGVKKVPFRGFLAHPILNTEDRLTSVEDGNGAAIAAYYYDPFGRRLWKDVVGARTYFSYSDEGLVGEYGNSGAEIKSYGYRPGSTWTTDPLFMKVGGQYYFYQNDHLGTPQKMTAVNGAVVWSATYSSFGEAAVDASSTITSPFRFAGQYYDSETGFHYNYHRYYDPRTGRYLTPDPSHSIQPRGHLIPYLLPYFLYVPQEHNLYSYAKNNSIIWYDPLGLMGGSPSDLLPSQAEGLGDVLGTACVARNCKHGNPRDYWAAYADCMQLYAEFRKSHPAITDALIEQLGGEEAFLSACASKCEKVTHTPEYRKKCKKCD